MPRPRKWRKVCFMPDSTAFGPLTPPREERKSITMAVDEYETIRLIDANGMSQEECAERMNVARTTVQRIYTSARKKLAQSLVFGHVLKIEGGNFELCTKDDIKNCGCCRRGECFPPSETPQPELGE